MAYNNKVKVKVKVKIYFKSGSLTTLPFIDNFTETCSKRQDDWQSTVQSTRVCTRSTRCCVKTALVSSCCFFSVSLEFRMIHWMTLRVGRQTL